MKKKSEIVVRWKLEFVLDKNKRNRNVGISSESDIWEHGTRKHELSSIGEENIDDTFFAKKVLFQHFMTTENYYKIRLDGDDGQRIFTPPRIFEFPNLSENFSFDSYSRKYNYQSNSGSLNYEYLWKIYDGSCNFSNLQIRKHI